MTCNGQRVDDIVINPAPPSITSSRRVPVSVTQAVRRLHATTRAEIIRRFLLLEIGEPCTELRRSESERILRAQPYLVEASVLTYADDIGGVVVLVRTVDEYSLIASVQINQQTPYMHAVRLGSANLSGEGVRAVADWRQGGAYRSGYGLGFTDYQFSGRPYILSGLSRRDPLGSEWFVDGLHPFYTDLQRIAWRARAGENDDYVEFESSPGVGHALRLVRSYFDVGGIVRIGPPGRLSLFGASFSQDREEPGTTPVVITDSGLATDTSSVLRNRYVAHHIARVNVLWGVRDIDFVRTRGIDALTATQDVPIGFQLGTLFGRSLPVIGSRDDDIFMAADLYLGIGSPHDLVRFQLQGEARRNNDLDVWDGILTSGRAAHYLQVTGDETIITSAEWSGGWRMRTPFAVTLGDFHGGVRGYGFSHVPGGQRGVLRLEDRHFLGRFPGVADVGFAAFGDAGRLWAADVPYGQNVAFRSSIGFSLMAAVPPRSARMWRFDIALPTGVEPGHRIEFRFSNIDRTTFFWREPPDVEGARERTVPTSIYSWP